MKRNLTFLIAFILIIKVSAQDYEPQILILSPNKIKFEKGFDSEIEKSNEKIRQYSNSAEQQQYIKSEEFKKQPENLKLMTLSSIKFSENMDFFKYSSFITQQYLSYRFYERFTNLLILLSDSKSNGDKKELKTIADREKLQYIINFTKIEILKKDGISFAKILLQLFDNESNTFLINKEYEGDWNNPGFEFACTDSSINCAINNALSQGLSEVIYSIASNNKTLKKKRQLAQQRFDELISNYYQRPFNNELLKKIVSENDSDIIMNDLYQVIINPTESKFVAFFIDQVAPQDLKTLSDSKRDKNVKILTNKDIKDEGYLSDIPKTYAYIVKGVKYNNKWYYEKSDVTYFEAENLESGKQEYFNNLQKWGFFEDNSIKSNLDFWETRLFEKVRDLRKDPDWDKYGETIWKTEEANNRDYVGMYEIVADAMKKELESGNRLFEKSMKENILKPAFEKMKNTRPTEYSMFSEHSLIYPKERDVLINPVLITNSEGINTIHYYVVFSDSDNIYEWTYFTPTPINEKIGFGSKVVEQINTLTDWTFSYKNLNNRTFWDNYVLVKSNNDYKYLKKMKNKMPSSQ